MKSIIISIITATLLVFSNVLIGLTIKPKMQLIGFIGLFVSLSGGFVSLYVFQLSMDESALVLASMFISEIVSVFAIRWLRLRKGKDRAEGAN